MGMSFEGFEKHGANAMGRIAISVTTTPTLLLTLAGSGTAIPAVTGKTKLYAHTAVVQTGSSNTGTIAWGTESAISTASQNTVAYGAGREIPLRFNDLALLYFVGSTGTQTVYIQYYYYDPAVEVGPVCGLK